MGLALSYTFPLGTSSKYPLDLVPEKIILRSSKLYICFFVGLDILGRNFLLTPLLGEITSFKSCLFELKVCIWKETQKQTVSLKKALNRFWGHGQWKWWMGWQGDLLLLFLHNSRVANSSSFLLVLSFFSCIIWCKTLLCICTNSNGTQWYFPHNGGLSTCHFLILKL